MSKVYTRLDRKVKTRVLGVTEDDELLIEARWDKEGRNVLTCSRDYFKNKYGVSYEG